MTVNEYQYDALRTETNVQPDDLFGRTLQGLLGLGGEAGECLDIFKSTFFRVMTLIQNTLHWSLGMWPGI